MAGHAIRTSPHYVCIAEHFSSSLAGLKSIPSAWPAIGPLTISWIDRGYRGRHDGSSRRDGHRSQAKIVTSCIGSSRTSSTSSTAGSALTALGMGKE